MKIDKFGKGKPTEKYTGEFMYKGDEVRCVCGGDFRHVSANINGRSIKHIYKCVECGNMIESDQL